MSLLVPHLLRCLRSPLQELRAGGYMVVAQLARRTAMTVELTDRLFTAVAKVCGGTAKNGGGGRGCSP